MGGGALACVYIYDPTTDSHSKVFNTMGIVMLM